jgi:hypothetical protein
MPIGAPLIGTGAPRKIVEPSVFRTYMIIGKEFARSKIKPYYCLYGLLRGKSMIIYELFCNVVLPDHDMETTLGLVRF